MEAKSDMESVADVEKQQLLLPATAADEKPSGCDGVGVGDGDRKACSCTTASLTATRALALVVLAAGAAFAAQLAAREEYVLLAVLASQAVSFCVFTSLLALCALPVPEEGSKPRRRVAVPVAPWARLRRLLLWPFAMALPVSMACWAAESAPISIGVALLALAMAAVLACYAEVVRSLWPGE